MFTSYPGQLRRSGAVHSVDYLPEVLRLRIGNAATLSNSSLLFLSCSPCFFESRFWLVFVTITWKILNLSIVFSVQNSQVPLKKTFDENRDTLSCLWCDYWLLEWSIKKLRGSAPCTVQMERSGFKAVDATPLSTCFLSPLVFSLFLWLWFSTQSPSPLYTLLKCLFYFLSFSEEAFGERTGASCLSFLWWFYQLLGSSTKKLCSSPGGQLNWSAPAANKLMPPL